MANELQTLKDHVDYCTTHWMEGASLGWKLHLAQMHSLCSILGPKCGVREPYLLRRTIVTRRARNDDWDTVRTLVWARNILEASSNDPVMRTPEEEVIVDERLARA